MGKGGDSDGDKERKKESGRKRMGRKRINLKDVKMNRKFLVSPREFFFGRTNRNERKQLRSFE